MKCKDCGGKEKLQKHSLIGGHKPPFIFICEKCHNKRHGVTRRKIASHRENTKIKKGTRNRKILNKK